jgi:hypothetical protein
MRKIIGNVMVMVFLVVLTSWARADQIYTWQKINRDVAPVVPKPEAYLKVYSEARVFRDGDIPKVDRVPYTIYSADGKKLRWVAFNDEDPKLITLPPGKYVIVPETNMTKTEIIGAILEPGQLTEVHMKGEDPKYAPMNF